MLMLLFLKFLREKCFAILSPGHVFRLAVHINQQVEGMID